MLKSYYLDVRDAEHTVNRFEVRFASDDEAIQHSKELAASLRQRHFPNRRDLLITVLDQANRKIYGELVYPEGGDQLWRRRVARAYAKGRHCGPG
jgi:hypothetical protein